jgi:small-conductance mechanosensitive channel
MPFLEAEGPIRWLNALLLAMLLCGVGELGLWYLFRGLRWLVAHTPTLSDDQLVEKIRLPTRVLVLAGALHIAARYAGIGWLIEGLTVAEWLLGTFLMVEAADTLIVDLVMADRLKIHVPALLRQVVIGLVYTGVLLAVLGHVSGMDITPLLATTSVASLVLGLALQQPLSNLFAGLVLHLDRPFQEGDWVLVGLREGRIEDIGWRSTRLRTLCGDSLILPNNFLMGAEILNFSLPNQHTARLIPVAVSPLVPPDALEGWVREELAGIDGIVHELPVKVWLSRFEATAHHYTLKVWVVDFSRHDDVESEVMKRIWYRLQQEGVPMVLETVVRLIPGR